MTGESEYGLSPEKARKQIDSPAIDYRPPRPKNLRGNIGLIGAGGISEYHLKAYRDCGFNVVAIASRTRENAERRRDEFFPSADVHDHYHELIQRKDILVVDVTPHPEDRLPILRDSIKAGKHVLSQKPLVLDLSDGQELIQLAQEHSVHLVVNQNGRWAPHFSYLRSAVASGLIGEVTSVDFSLQWDQTWIAGNESFESIEHLILFDFGVHWFDMANCLMRGNNPESVYASVTRCKEQAYRPPSIASCVITYPNAQVRMSFHGHARFGEEDMTTVVGTKGTLRSRGPGLNDQPTMQVFLESGQCEVPLAGCWFDEGFQGTMGELLCAIEEDREPTNNAADNLRSLQLCFAAVQSADSGKAVKAEEATRINADK